MSDEERLVRLFVAIGVPQDLKDRLTSVPRRVSGARWVKNSQLHLTLAFIGKAAVESTKGALAEVRASSFELRFRSAGHFSHRVLWAGLERKTELLELQAAVEDALEPTGYAREHKAYVPHVTLARLKTPVPNAVKNQITDHCKALDALELAPFPVSEFLLYSSVLGPKGPKYEVEARFALNGA